MHEIYVHYFFYTVIIFFILAIWIISRLKFVFHAILFKRYVHKGLSDVERVWEFLIKMKQVKMFITNVCIF